MRTEVQLHANMHLSVLIVLIKWFIISDCVTVKRKCCSKGEVFNGEVCVAWTVGNGQKTLIAEKYGFPQCDESTVLVELGSQRNQLSISGNSSLRATVQTKTYTSDSYCVDFTTVSNLPIAIVCLKRSVCREITCIRHCPRDPFTRNGAKSLALSNNISNYGLITDCTTCDGEEFELDPVAYPEHEYFIRPDGSLHLTHQSKQITPDKYIVRYSDHQGKRVKFDIRRISCPLPNGDIKFFVTDENNCLLQSIPRFR